MQGSYIMQPKTKVKFDRNDFEWVKKTIKLMSKASRERKRDPGYASSLPEELGIQLTYGCNLRCRHCYQWNDRGFFHRITNGNHPGDRDLDIALVEKLLRETRERQSRLYLWGGEPLVHREWEAIARLLEKDQRWAVLCTNGLLLESKLASILPISSKLALLVSLDGFREEHDAIRGPGTFNRTMENLDTYLSLRKRGKFKGKISINCVINEGIVYRMFDFLEFCERKGFDSLYFTFPWYISPETTRAMDAYYRENFSWLNPLPENRKPTWHSYAYHLDPPVMDTLRSQIRKLNARQWNIRIRLQPPLEPDEYKDFVLGSARPAQKRRHCLAVSNRMEIHADGKISACKFFPEFIIGDLYRQSAVEIWRSEKFGKVREIINRGLMPVCSKCVLLYLGGR
jgi:radical SAM protein with 4Fe4S-binding SPASM domain